MERNLRVKIVSLWHMAEHIRDYAGRHVVSIREPHRCRNEYNTIDRKADTFGSMIVLKMHDIWLPEHTRFGYTLPREEQIRELLEWSKGKRDFVVHCKAGVSRSSAAAYVLACRLVPPSEAIKLLDPYKHDPNELIVQHGANLLKNPAMMTELQKFNGIAKKASSGGGILINPPDVQESDDSQPLIYPGSGIIFPSR